MTGLAALTGRPVEGHLPWPRLLVTGDTWQKAINGLVEDRWTLSGLWGDDGIVHMALMEASDLRILSLSCPDGHFPSVGYSHPPAIRLERTIADLFGLVPLGAADHPPLAGSRKLGTAPSPWRAARQRPAGALSLPVR